MVVSFKEYIRNKKVIFVGPSPILQGTKSSSYIDSFDVVIKTGSAASINRSDYLADYGSRVDVLYLNSAFCRDMKEVPVREWKGRGVKYLRVRQTEAKSSEIIKNNFISDLIDHDFIFSILPGTLPLMGTIAIMECLNLRAKEVHITGMDFNTQRGNIEKINYPDPENYSEYIDGYISDRLKERMDKVRTFKQKDAHDHIANAKIIKKLYDDGKVFMENFILDKLNLILSYGK